MAGRAPRAPRYVATFTPASCQARVKPVCLGVKPVCLACVPGEEPAPRNWVPRSAAHTRLASCPRPRPASPPPAPPTLQPPHPAAHVAPVISRPELAPPPARQEALLAGDALLVLSAAQVKEGGRRFAAVVAQAWNVSDAVAPTLLHQVSPRGRSAYCLDHLPRTYLAPCYLLRTPCYHVLAHQVILEGSLVTARLIGSLAYVAVSTAPRLPEGGARFSEVPEVDVMPWVGGGGGGGGGLEPAALCADVSYVAEAQYSPSNPFHPPPPSPPSSCSCIPPP